MLKKTVGLIAAVLIFVSDVQAESGKLEIRKADLDYPVMVPIKGSNCINGDKTSLDSYCATKEGSPSHKLTLTLEKKATVETVKLWNRVGCWQCKDRMMGAIVKVNGKVCGTVPNHSVSSHVIDCSQPIVGDKITLETTDGNSLHLQEVEVWGIKSNAKEESKCQLCEPGTSLQGDALIVSDDERGESYYCNEGNERVSKLEPEECASFTAMDFYRKQCCVLETRCKVFTVGPGRRHSPRQSKVSATIQVDEGYICPTDIPKEKRKNTDYSGANDRFSAEQSGTTLTVERSDAKGSSWGMNLAFECCKEASTGESEKTVATGTKSNNFFISIIVALVALNLALIVYGVWTRRKSSDYVALLDFQEE